MPGPVTIDVFVGAFIAIGGSLLSIIAFFIKQLLSKINRLGITMAELDKKLAVLINDTQGYSSRFNRIEDRLKELETSVWRDNTSN